MRCFYSTLVPFRFARLELCFHAGHAILGMKATQGTSRVHFTGDRFVY
jgi:hypothetical protein